MIRAMAYEEIGPAVAAFGERAYQELSPEKVFNPAHFLAVWRMFYETGMGAIFCEDEGRGYFGVVIHQDPFDQVRTLQQVFFYVPPEHRRYQRTLAFIHAIESWAKERKVPVIHMTAAAVRSNFGAILTRNGYTTLETAYEKVVECHV